MDVERYQRRVATGLLLGIGLMFTLLGGRLVYVNTVMASHLLSVVERQHLGQMPIPARRGLILDVYGRVLAGSELVPSVFADPLLIEDLPASAIDVASALNMHAGELEERVRSCTAPRFCWIKRRVSPGEARAVEALRLPGFGVIDEPVRRYPLGSTSAHVLGFVGAEGTGLAGIELQLDAHLRGRDGRVRSIHDVRRRAVWRLEEGTSAVTDGGHAALTIDSVIQSTVEQELAARVEAFRAESGVAVVIAAKTGDILAMACWPSFEPGHYASAGPEVWRNRAVVDPVEPGSTIKPIIAGGAVAGGYVSSDATIFCHHGEYALPGRVVRDTTPHGNLSFEDVLVKSSNIGMAVIGQRVGNAGLHDIVRRFGFGQPTGIEFPGEAEGIVRPLREWNAMTTTSVPMGYEIGVTPLQLAVGFVAVVNGGVLLKPRLVRALLDADGTAREVFEGPQPVRRVLPEPLAKYLTGTVMRAVVARPDADDSPAGYPMVGKTGTAKLTRPGRKGYADGAYLSSFVGAAPADDPEIVVLVMIRRPDPSIGYYGRVVSLPVVRNIIAQALPYLEVPPCKG